MITCNKCGNPLPFVEADCFQYDGADAWEEYPVHACSNRAVYIDLPTSWAGDCMSEEEQMESIRCPHCHKYPFNDEEIQVYGMLRTVMFDNCKHPGEDDIPVDWIKKQIDHTAENEEAWRQLVEIWKEATAQSELP